MTTFARFRDTQGQPVLINLNAVLSASGDEAYTTVVLAPGIGRNLAYPFDAFCRMAFKLDPNNITED